MWDCEDLLLRYFVLGNSQSDDYTQCWAFNTQTIKKEFRTAYIKVTKTCSSEDSTKVIYYNSTYLHAFVHCHIFLHGPDFTPQEKLMYYFPPMYH